GKNNISTVSALYALTRLNAEVVEFISPDEMPHKMAVCDLVICRAGAGTLASLCAVGVAALLVPYPSASDNHQVHNAQYLVDKKAAWMKEQAQCDENWLISWLDAVLPSDLLAVAENAYALRKPNTVATMARHCLEGTR
ncbi:MAG: glycosyltransferase, partial [Gammaproteobacteria bacterium]|nr:glycosyltransferase [Gammaproteobacteria bacterium]